MENSGNLPPIRPGDPGPRFPESGKHAPPGSRLGYGTWLSRGAVSPGSLLRRKCPTHGRNPGAGKTSQVTVDRYPLPENLDATPVPPRLGVARFCGGVREARLGGASLEGREYFRAFPRRSAALLKSLWEVWGGRLGGGWRRTMGDSMGCSGSQVWEGGGP
jgi:hypothetical protein